MNGSLLCARYAFAPNYYKYCGPDENKLLENYVNNASSDPGLESLLGQFDALYSYLKSIAHANGLIDPFDARVVEAYWIGNNLLDAVSQKETYDELMFGQHLKDRLPQKYIKWLTPKITKGAKLHHSFHVFNVFIRTGHHALLHTVETMDQCRIGWGKVIEIKNSKLKIQSQKVSYKNGKLYIKPSIKTIQARYSMGAIKKGDIITYHWGWMCDRIDMLQAKQLAHYTRLHLGLANQTI